MREKNDRETKSKTKHLWNLTHPAIKMIDNDWCIINRTTSITFAPCHFAAPIYKAGRSVEGPGTNSSWKSKMLPSQKSESNLDKSKDNVYFNGEDSFEFAKCFRHPWRTERVSEACPITCLGYCIQAFLEDKYIKAVLLHELWRISRKKTSLHSATVSSITGQKTMCWWMKERGDTKLPLAELFC